jgi:hypothetical protein
MTNVFQTICNNTNGNCLAAVWASLLHLNIDEVPNFVEYEDDHKALCEFIEHFGYEYACYLINRNRKDLPYEVKSQYCYFESKLPDAFAVNSYYDATVYSPGFWDQERYENDPTYKPVTHAVVVDKNFNVVHDPNPKYQGLKSYPLADQLDYNGVIGVSLYRSIKSESSK